MTATRYISSARYKFGAHCMPITVQQVPTVPCEELKKTKKLAQKVENYGTNTCPNLLNFLNNIIANYTNIQCCEAGAGTFWPEPV